MLIEYQATRNHDQCKKTSTPAKRNNRNEPCRVGVMRDKLTEAATKASEDCFGCPMKLDLFRVLITLTECRVKALRNRAQREALFSNRWRECVLRTARCCSKTNATPARSTWPDTRSNVF